MLRSVSAFAAFLFFFLPSPSQSACLKGLQDTEHLPIYEAPDTDAAVVVTVPATSCRLVADVPSCTPTWCKVAYDGRFGWAQKQKLEIDSRHDAQSFNYYVLKSLYTVVALRADRGFDLHRGSYTQDLAYGSPATLVKRFKYDAATGKFRYPGGTGDSMCVVGVAETLIEGLNVYAGETGDMTPFTKLAAAHWQADTTRNNLRRHLWEYEDVESKGAAHALYRFNIGRQTVVEDLRPGDTFKLNRTTDLFDVREDRSLCPAGRKKELCDWGPAAKLFIDNRQSLCKSEPTSERCNWPPKDKKAKRKKLCELIPSAQLCPLIARAMCKRDYTGELCKLTGEQICGRNASQDLCKLDAGGHSTMFVAFVGKDGNKLERYSEEATGVRYFTSQATNGVDLNDKPSVGMGFRTEWFAGKCPNKTIRAQSRCHMIRSDKYAPNVGYMLHPQFWTEEIGSNYENEAQDRVRNLKGLSDLLLARDAMKSKSVPEIAHVWLNSRIDEDYDPGNFVDD